MAQVWEVVGGADKGGILVREGQGLRTLCLEERLATGATVEEVELIGERLHYRLRTGAGPQQGWVSTAAGGKDLLVRATDGTGAVDSPLLGVWLYGAEGRQLHVTKIGSGQLRCYTQLPPVTDVFGILQSGDDDWFHAELRLRVGHPVGSIRLRLDEDGTTLRFNFRATGKEEWDDEGVATKGAQHPEAREPRPWSSALSSLRGEAEAALRAGPGGDGAADWPQLRCSRLLAWSDLHVDMGENLRHFEAVERREGEALVISGDVCTGLALLERMLRLCKDRFDEVFYVPGNHEMWADATKTDGQRQTSLEKFVEIISICARTGVRTSPAFIAEGVAICPLFSWYKANFTGSWVAHGGFDNTTYWPEVDADSTHNPQLPEIADFFIGLNVGRVAAAAALKESGELKTLWTFSHFLPRPDLNQGNFMLGCLGCTELEDQIRKAGAAGHLFGHTHQGTERMIDGVRYVQQPLGYPTDGHREERPLLLWCAGSMGSSAESILACLLPAAAELAADRIRGALWGALCADAMGMPVHCYYGGPREITFRYGGPIKKYMQPYKFHDPSFMIGEATPAIGKVINHGMARRWEPVDATKSRTRGYSMHGTLQAGENTLEGHMLRLYMRLVAASGGNALDPSRLRDEYIGFMTTKGSHNDTFACVYHRVFFARYADGMPPEDCPIGGEDIETIESVSTQIPVLLSAARRGPEQAENEIYQAIRVTRQCTRVVANFGRILSGAVRRILAGEGLKQVAEAISAELYPESGPLATLIQGRKDPMVSTFLVENFPSLLHYMYRYPDSYEDLVLANVNIGGENTHRGHILGALAGAAHGLKGVPKDWIDGLVSRDEIAREIEAFVAAIC